MLSAGEIAVDWLCKKWKRESERMISEDTVITDDLDDDVSVVL